MVPPAKLILIGYWRDDAGNWPDPTHFIDPSWDDIDRQMVAAYLSRGFYARNYMGFSACRICGKDNGAHEYSDGTYVWPEGLSHYVEDHGVRLPEKFVDHALRQAEHLETAERDEDWWRTIEVSPDA